MFYYFFFKAIAVICFFYLFGFFTVLTLDLPDSSFLLGANSGYFLYTFALMRSGSDALCAKRRADLARFKVFIG